MARRILLIEDDESLQIAMRYLLENLGYELVTAEDHEHAAIAIEHGPYDAAIVDYFLRNIPSTDLITELRRRYPAMPLVCSTAARANEIELDPNAPTPDAFLYKPFEARELRELLAKLIV